MSSSRILGTSALFVFFILASKSIYALDFNRIDELIERFQAVSTQEEAVQLLPDKKLTLPFLLNFAAIYSQPSMIIQTKRIDLAAFDALERQYRNPTLFFNAQSLDSKLAGSGAFAPDRNKRNALSFGHEQNLLHGTRFSTRFRYEKLDQRLDASGFPPGLDLSTNSHEARLEMMVSQPLLRNRWGQQFKLDESFTKLRTNALKWEIKSDTEKWMLDLVELYYFAWLIQAQVRAAEANLSRRNRLRSITQIRIERGTAERPDLLQAQGAVIEAQSQLNGVILQLEGIWYGLVYNLGLPESWLKFDPRTIPLQLENFLEESLLACKKRPQVNFESSELNRLQALQQMSENRLKRAKSDLLPNADLYFRFSTNAIDNSKAQNTISDLPQFDHNALEVGLNLVWPLERKVERSQFIQSYGQKLRSQAMIALTEAQEKVEWENNCKELLDQQKRVSDYKSIFRLQAERLTLENERFQIGRGNMTQVIMAGDDLTRSEMLLREAEVRLYQKVWQILSLSGDMIDKLDENIRAGLSLDDPGGVLR